MDRRITLGSLFDGIGGFPLCSVILGITPVWAAEVEPGCVAVTRRHFPDMLHFGDVSKINGAEIPPVDIITFGSPCQDLSTAGKRAGLDGERSGLFMQAVRIIYEMRESTNGKYPTYIVWENVPGAFSSHNGHDFQTVLKKITKTDIPMPASGKWAHAGVVRVSGICAAWRLLDAQYWGVPQSRKRIYLIGSFGSDSAQKILFKCDSVQRYHPSGGAQEEEITAEAARSVGDSYCYDARGNGSGKVAPTITGDHNSRVSDYSAVLCQSAGFLDGASKGAGSIGFQDECSPTLRAGMRPNCIIEEVCKVIDSYGFQGQNSVTASGVNMLKEQAPTLTANKNADVVYALQGSMIGREDKNGPNGSGIKENISPTLTVADKHAVVYALNRPAFNAGKNAKYDFEITDSGINSTLVAKGPSAVAYEQPQKRWIVRRLTPLECERLQGYPDNWTVIPQIENMTDDEYEFFKGVYLLNKSFKGQQIKKEPTKKQIVKWYNKLGSDSMRYKALGNSLAIPCALRVIGYIADFMRKDEKQSEQSRANQKKAASV